MQPTILAISPNSNYFFYFFYKVFSMADICLALIQFLSSWKLNLILIGHLQNIADYYTAGNFSSMWKFCISLFHYCFQLIDNKDIFLMFFPFKDYIVMFISYLNGLWYFCILKICVKSFASKDVRPKNKKHNSWCCQLFFFSGNLFKIFSCYLHNLNLPSLILIWEWSKT